MDDATLGGYLTVHQRPPAFEGLDGRAYSVAIYVDAVDDLKGRFGAALLFIRWSAAGDQPEGHLETDYLDFGPTQENVEEAVKRLSLHQVKAHLDRLVAGAGSSAW
jgi:hypothetical protein